jgi:sugar lactone lactonase YvrE
MVAASLFIATFGITGCGDDPVKAGVAKGCTLNSDCNDGLVCGFGLCHQECEESSDCPAGQRCVQTDKSNVCQLNDEAECHFNTDCAKPLVCAVDLQCRNQCNGKADCLPSQECADHVCAEPEEVDEDGGLKGAVTGNGGEGGGGPGPSGGSGGSGAASTGGTSNGGSSGSSMAGAGGEGPPACTPGGDCELDGMPCQLGIIVCDGDTPSCQVMSDADDGTECGTDKVCSDGACVGCVLGDDCQPDANNPCIAGTVSCAQGPACDSDGNVKNGTSCGADKVCNAGSCDACVVDQACDPVGQACKNGKLSCSNGPACLATTNKAPGLGCGTDQVCNSAGACVSCVQDGACSPNGNECHVGVMDCTNGPNCADTGNPATDGLVCEGPNTYDFCKAGVCAACQNNNPCVPTNPCHKGTLNCGTAPPTCNDTLANADDGLVCGDNKSCISGACVTNDRVLTVTSAQPAAVAIDAPFSPVTVKLVDKNGANVQGAKVDVVASAGAYAAASANTNASGVATINGRVGRAIGSYTFTLSAPGAASTQFTVSAVAPTDKHIFTLVNVNHLNNGFGTPGPGTISQLSSYARAVAAAKDGTLYLASYCNVYSLSPAGVLAKVAGAGTPSAENCGASGDSGLGTTLNLYDVRSLALDEDNGFLYIADFSNRRVMQLTLADGSLLRFAGDKNATNADPWGDGFPADSAYLQPVSVQVAPNGDLYIGDTASQRLRKVDFNSNIITTAFRAPTSCPTDGPLSFSSCYYYSSDSCHMTWDKDGKAFISAQLCGGGVSTSFYGIARVDGPGAFTLIAGKNGAATIPEGGVATSAAFGAPPALAFDKAGNLFLAASDDNRVLRIDAITSKITTVAGNGTAAYAGDYVLGTAAQVSAPTNLAFDAANNLYFGDSGNRAIRSLWNIGATVAPTATLATTGGTGQTVKIDAPFSALTVKLTDSNNANISGAEVRWKRLNEGSGLGSTGAATASTKTIAAGTSSMTGRVGLALGDYKFEASFTDIHGVPVAGSPRTFTVAAEAPTAGHIFPVINYVHTSLQGGTPGPATFAKVYSQAGGVTAASDGTIYVADYSAVYQITPQGEATVLAGTPGTAGFSGDSGPAAGAKLSYPRGLALDETRKVLYIADSNNSRIRMVSLETGVIETLAGGSTDNTAPYGDGGVGVDAHIGSVDSVTVGPDGKVYFPDKTHYRIRVVDPDTTIITTWLNGTYNTGSCLAGTVSLYYPTEHSAIRFAADGSAFISGYICQGTTATNTQGIIRRASNGTTTRILGLSTGAQTDNIDAIATLLPDLGDFILDANEDIVISTWTNLRVRKINMTTGKISTIAGDGTLGYFVTDLGNGDPGAYEPASGVRFRYPSKLANWPGGHLLIADRDNYTVRMIW